MINESKNFIMVHGFPRIHICLIDLGHVTRRTFGGAGFSIEFCPVEISYRDASEFRVFGLELLDDRGRVDAQSILAAVKCRAKHWSFELNLHSMPPQHVGYGSKTSLLMSIVRAIDVGQNLGLTEREVQQLSGRGGASGVGLHTFFKGGLVTDGGHRNDVDSLLLPSGAVTNHDIPPLLAWMCLPDCWEISLLMPLGDSMHGASEVEFFHAHTPVPKGECLKVLASIYHGLLPAVAEQDLSSTKEALKEIRSCGFKAREVKAQSETVRKLISEIDELPMCAVGMSSMGPLIYAIHMDSDIETKSYIRTTAELNDVNVVAVCRARNQGHELLL